MLKKTYSNTSVILAQQFYYCTIMNRDNHATIEEYQANINQFENFIGRGKVYADGATFGLSEPAALASKLFGCRNLQGREFICRYDWQIIKDATDWNDLRRHICFRKIKTSISARGLGVKPGNSN